MEVKEWIMIISALIVVTGWFINSYLNRRHEISKKRLEYRLETLHSFITVFLSLSASPKPFDEDKKLNDKIINARVNFQLYGYQDESKLFQDFAVALEKHDNKEVTVTVNKLIKLTRARIRNELKLPKFDL
jgi:hypothetical protein